VLQETPIEIQEEEWRVEKRWLSKMCSSSEEVREEMSKILTLRGNFTVDDNAILTDKQIFIYEAGDLTKGWEVDSAYIWPRDTRAEIGTADEINATQFDQVSNAADNRQMGWCNAGYQLRSSSVGDFLANSGNPPNPASFTLDPQHIVKKGLWLNFCSTSDSTTSPPRLWNYLVVLKPRKLSTSEAILHLIKNVAQDVDN
jgi:hypothetical protein